jgi:hypothetical protein
MEKYSSSKLNSRKIHLVFDQDQDGNLTLSTTKGSLKNARSIPLPQEAEKLHSISPSKFFGEI